MRRRDHAPPPRGSPAGRRTTRRTRTSTPTSSAACRERLGPLGARVHAGRSRNDQVAVATRLWAERACRALAVGRRRPAGGARDRRRGAAGRRPARLHAPAARPADPARPLAGGPRLGRSSATRARLRAAHAAADVCPLGAGALAGSSLPLDRSLGGRRARIRQARFESTLDAVVRPRLRLRPAVRLRALLRAPLAAGRGGRDLHLAGVRVRRARRRGRARLLDDAAEEEPAGRRAPARPGRRRDRAPGRVPGGRQGASAGLRQRPAGGQGARCSARSTRSPEPSRRRPCS